jgi:hypothetical protein
MRRGVGGAGPQDRAGQRAGRCDRQRADQPDQQRRGQGDGDAGEDGAGLGLPGQQAEDPEQPGPAAEADESGP